MFNAPLIEFLLRGIPESLLFIFAGYAFSKSRIDFKRFLIGGFLFSVIGYLIKLLPINFGIHSVLVIIACIIVLNNINKIPLMRAISSSLIVTIIGFASESLNALFIQNVLKKDLNVIFENSIQKTLYGLPSMALMGIVIGIVYFICYKKDKLVDVLN